MKFKIQYKFLFILFLTSAVSVKAQKKDENIGTEVVNVVKPYTPTISDAFKVKETPAAEDDDNTKKEPIKYNIFSFPVASTFTPSKGRAAGVDREKEGRLFKNYFTSGFGLYMTAFAELYVTENIGDNDYVSGMVKHLSSNGGIKDLELNDQYMNSSIDLTYGSKTSEMTWNADVGYQMQKYYWYGLPSDYGLTLPAEDRSAVIDRIDEMQTYHNAYVGGRLTFSESAFNEISLNYNRFFDAYDSAENRLLVKPSFSFDIGENTIKTEIIADYVGGEFANDYFDIAPIKYGFANFGISPSFSMTKDDWSFDLGASAYYSADLENRDNGFYIYPNAIASLKVVGDVMVFYAGAQGTLQQNTYRDFTNANPYVSPTLFIQPTDRQFDTFAGLKGKLSNYVSYNVRGSLMSERSKPMFIHNYYDDSILIQEMYQYGNSFGLVYDNVRTLGFLGELKADFSKNVSLGINAKFNKYTMDNQEEAWNLPELQFGANLDVNITPKLYAGADVFFTGERKDLERKFNAVTGLNEFSVKTLNSYFDANAHVGFKYSERLTFWLRFNNIANQAYEKWLHYPVQPFQAMVGASYKFDF